MSGRRLLALVAAAACAAAIASQAGARSGTAAASAVVRSAIFYYPWYSNPTRDGRWAHWWVVHDGVPVLSTRYYPRRGLYSSSNPRLVGAQMAEIAATGVDAVVVSWWGEHSPENARLPLVTQAARAHGLAVAIHLEPYPGRTPASAAADIARLREAGYEDFYLYDADREPAQAWAEALAPLSDVRIFGHTTLVGRARAAGFDGVYTYDVATWTGVGFRRLCTQARQAGLLCAPSVGPGYDARLATRHELVRSRQDGATYDRMWKSALRASADLVTITSYNEWQEGTQIEPARPQVERPGYDGAWGARGVAAQTAYLAATARWVAELELRARQ
ncbi:MAG TPA: hypothetical protein VNJ53_10925 [Gaiellaceae bacterium]|nr:hypothetical protein [Gaiellaceae bacterium]